MSQYWPPDDSESSRQGRSRPLYGSPNQGSDRSYPGYGPPSQRRDRPNPDYGPPGQRQYSGGWAPSQEEQWPQQAPAEASRGYSPYAQQYPQYPQNPQYAQYPEQSQYPQYQPYAQYPQSQYAGDPYGSPYGYGPPVAEPRQGTNWLLPIVLVVLLVMVGASAAGAYALTHRGPQGTSTTGTGGTTDSATATPGSPAGFRQFTDAATHVRFVIPQNWSTTGSVSGSSGLLVGSQDRNSAVVVKQVNVAGTAATDAQAADGFLTGAASSGGSVANKAGPTNVHLAGETWVQESADVTSEGVTLHAVVLVATHGDATFVIAYVSPPSTFNAVNTQYFQPILKSFAFTQ